jgi:hypothetical protein
LGATSEVSAVIKETFRIGLRLVLALLLPHSIVCSKSLPNLHPTITISVHNDAGVPAGTLRHAEEEAQEVFHQAGIEVRWLHCSPAPIAPEEEKESSACREAVYPEHLQLRIARRPIGLRRATMGISYLSDDGKGCYADLFYERMEELHEKSKVSLGSLLGHVAAHETGHLLLGTNSHAPRGIMRAIWQGEELASASKGVLFFSGSESRQIKERLAMKAGARNEARRAAAYQVGE